MERAAVAGALAIAIPLRYRKHAASRLDQLLERQRVVEPNQWGYVTMHSTDSRPPRPWWRRLPSLFSVEKHRTDYYVLPPETRLKTDKPYIVISSSNVLPQLLAMLQLVLSSRQLYLNYDTSIKQDGLSSAYLVVPYILMTMVNFVANAFVGSYAQVLLLPKRPAEVAVDASSATGTDTLKTFVIGNNQLEVPAADRTRKIDKPVVDYYREAEEGTDLHGEFNQWLQDNYDYLDVKIGSRTHRKRSEMWVSAFLIALVTLVIGLLTRFQIGSPARAAWFLIWLYALPSYALVSAIMPAMDSPKIWVVLVSLASLFIAVIMLIGLTGGTAVIAVGLMETMCGSVWEFSVRVWILIGFSTFLVITAIILMIMLCLGLFSSLHSSGILEESRQRQIYA